MRAEKLLFIFLFMLPIFSYSDGMIIPPHPQDPYPLVLNHYVNITVDDTYATYLVDQEFINEGPRDIEGTYVFPVPSGSIRNFQIVVGEKVIEGRLMGKEEARDLYQQYVRERGDASLLEYSGQETFSAKVYLKRGEKVRVQISYEQVIKESSGTYQVFYPLSPERYTTRPIDPVDIQIKIKAAGDMGFVLSPTHNVSISRTGTREALVRYYSKEIPDRDFQLFYGVTDRDYDVKALANRKAGQDGYFMLFIYPSSPVVESVQKDVVYVIDTSGSMSGSKIEQAKDALKYGLDQLSAGDRFSIITFSSETSSYKNSLSGTGLTIDAKKFVNGLDASGATNIQDALALASKQFSKSDGRMHIIILLTDGEDTTGHITRSIMEAITGCDCRIFPFGVGTDIDFELLDRISNEHGDGLPTYIRSDAELESSLKMFYDKISRPLLQNVRVSVEGTGIAFTDIYPKKVPDLFYGSQIVIAGKYSGSGSARVKVTGKISETEKSFEYPISLPESDSNPFVERTWAARKLGYLLDTIALEGETQGLKEEALAIATKYGLPSPYTSYVAVNERGEEVKRTVGISDAVGGWGAQANSMTTAASYKSTESYSYNPPQTKTIDDKTFVSVGGVWKDTSCGETVDTRVDFGSSEYFSLALNPQIARYLSVGGNVMLCTDKSVMVVGGKETPGSGSSANAGNGGVGGNGGSVPPGPIIGSGLDSGLGNGDKTPTTFLGSFMNVLPILILIVFGIAAAAYIIISRPHELQRSLGSEGEAQLYKALSSDTRIDILRVLEDGEGGRTPTFISERLGKSKATISEHLDKLVENGLVDKEEVEGRKWVFYRLTSKGKSAIRKGGQQQT